jgi:hypothetical protein
MSSRANLGVMGFVPEQLVPVSVGCYQVNLYPKLHPTASVVVHAHAYQICKSALGALNIDICILFDALGLQLNCMATNDGLIYDFTQVYEEGWFNPANLQVLSFHDSAWAIINNTTITSNPTVLLPVINGLVANRCQQDVRYVRVQLSLDFANLLGLRHVGATVLKLMYYIKLPQTSVNMTNGTNVAYVLTTFHGPANITAMTAMQVLNNIINPCLQRGPITLSGANFNLQEANTDSTIIKDQLINKILLLGFDSICALVFTILCPGYSDQPHAILDHIRQASPRPDGQMIIVSIHEFIQCIINVSCPFAAQKTLPISICNHIIQNLDCRIIPSFHKLYPDHATLHDLDGAFQCRKVQEILAATQQAEDEVHQVQEIARRITGQSFHYQVPPELPTADTPASPVKTGAYPSQAKRMLSKYQGNDGSPPGGAKTPYKRHPLKCFGCGGPHCYQDKNGNVTCPYSHDPTVKANAERKYKAFCQHLKDKYKTRMAKYRGRRGGGHGGGGCGGGGGRGSSG